MSRQPSGPATTVVVVSSNELVATSTPGATSLSRLTRPVYQGPWRGKPWSRTSSGPLQFHRKVHMSNFRCVMCATGQSGTSYGNGVAAVAVFVGVFCVAAGWHWKLMRRSWQDLRQVKELAKGKIPALKRRDRIIRLWPSCSR